MDYDQSIVEVLSTIEWSHHWILLIEFMLQLLASVD